MSTRSRFNVSACVITLAMVLDGCGALSRAVTGKPPSSNRRTVVAASFPYGDRSHILAAINEALSQAVEGGDWLEILLFAGTSGAALRVPFGAGSHHGRFVPSGRNPQAWEQSRKEMLAAARHDVVEAIDVLGPIPAAGLSDPAGALQMGLLEADDRRDGMASQVILIGTGVQRTPGFDFVVDPGAVLPKIVDISSAVGLRLVGIADFGAGVVNLDPLFVDRVRGAWNALCGSRPTCTMGQRP